MDGRSPVAQNLLDYAGSNPSVNRGSVSSVVGNLLGLDPTVKYRPSFIPVVRNQDDSLSMGYPSVFIDLLKAVSLPGHVAQGGAYTPDDVTNMALNVGMMGAPVGYATAPRGALAIGGARRAGISDEQLKALHDSALAAKRSGGAGLGSGSINKTVRRAGFQEDDLSIGKEFLNEMYGKIQARDQSRPKIDPLELSSLPHVRRYKLDNFKAEKEVFGMGERLGWHKNSIDTVMQSKKIDYNFDASVKKATLESIQREAKKRGYSIRHASGKASAKNASSLYLKRPDGKEIRVSDHYLPDTPQRQYNRETYGAPRWDAEYVLPNTLQNKTLDDLFNEIETALVGDQ